jgi:hypothetical protein
MLCNYTLIMSCGYKHILLFYYKHIMLCRVHGPARRHADSGIVDECNSPSCFWSR